ncbi:helix-turn-helix domain-containing protein [Spirillospora sp. NPDC052269]
MHASRPPRPGCPLRRAHRPHHGHAAPPGGRPAPVLRAPYPGQFDGTLAPLLEWITRRIAEPLPLEAIAARAGVSPRTLTRRFTDQLGTSPGQWRLAQCIATARDLLESTDLPKRPAPAARASPPPTPADVSKAPWAPPPAPTVAPFHPNPP